MNRFFKVGEAAKILGVSIQTMRRWEISGYLKPDRKSEGGTRYYSRDKLLGKKRIEADLTLAYARVSSHDQKKDLERQKSLLTYYCAAKGWNYEIISDLGSGMNYRKKGLKKILDSILEKKISRLVLKRKFLV